MEKDSKIYVAGHTGLVGSAVVGKLDADGYRNIIIRTHAELDLSNQFQTRKFFWEIKPEYVFLAAAKVGGIASNAATPADFIHENLMIQSNVIHESYVRSVEKLLFLGSSCIYPKDCPQPMIEKDLLGGPLESTNEAYAIAKIAGIKMCQAYNKQYGTNFISAMPPNVYGPNDNYATGASHVLQALIRKIHEAMAGGYDIVEIWGTGTPRREFLYVDDLADACLFLMNNYDDSEIVNVGTGKDISIAELAKVIAEIIGYTGKFIFNHDKPDGHMAKLVDVSKMRSLGWEASVSLKDGIQRTYAWYLDHIANCEG